MTSNTRLEDGLSWKGLSWAFTSVVRSNWQPLTWITYMLDYRVNGPDPEVFHFTNVCLHAANTIVLFSVFSMLTGLPWRSAFVAALFAVHPLHVESVAWVAERKDVLSALFWLLTMAAYVRYCRRGRTRYLVLASLTLALGLMAKPMLVSLPLILLLLDFWPLRRMGKSGVRLRGLLVEKLPMLVLALLSCGVTFWAQNTSGSMHTLSEYPLGIRVANAGVAYIGYLQKMLWPRDLAVFYPHPGDALPTWQVVGAFALFAAITATAFICRRRRPYLLVGWLWYVVSLIPVIGIVQVGGQAMADRYTYVPLVGVFVAVTWLVADLVCAPERSRAAAIAMRAGLAVLAAAIIVSLAAVAHWNVTYWKDTKTLFRHALRVDEKNSVAHLALGSALANEGNGEAAMRHWRRAIEVDPREYAARMNYATGLYIQGDLDAAMVQFREVVRTRPDFAEARNNLGYLLAGKGRYKEAIIHYKAALRAKPDYRAARDNLRRAEAAIGKR